MNIVPVNDLPVVSNANDTLLYTENVPLTFFVGAVLYPNGTFVWTPTEPQGPGTYPLTFSVSDGAATDTVAVNVTVNEVNDPPYADAGPDSAFPPGTEVTLDGTGSSDDGTLISYVWSFTYNGTDITLHGENVTFRFDTVGNYTVTLTVTDDGNLTDTAIVRIAIGSTFEVFLHPGWNLISIPTEEDDRSVEAVFFPIAGSYDSIQTYDAAAGVWLTYSPEAPAWLSDLHLISPDMGLWIHITDGDTVMVPLFGSPRETPSDITLYSGWNLVGYPTLAEGATLSERLAGIPWDMVQTGDQSRPYNLRTLPGTYVMRAGEGYWVHVETDCVWSV